jgi:hypothetical protein
MIVRIFSGWYSRQLRMMTFGSAGIFMGYECTGLERRAGRLA